MNTDTILQYGHQMVLTVVKDLPTEDWTRPGAYGTWSVKDIIGHLTLCEYALTEISQSILEEGHPTPTLDRLRRNFVEFRESEVQRRQSLTIEETVDEYLAAYEQNGPLVSRIPVDISHRNGTLPWYGAEFDLDDFIVFTFYGHKRERASQIAAFRDQLSKEQLTWNAN
jgi:hypothetical protein